VLVGELKNEQIEYRSATSCLMAIGNANGKHIITIEGINMEVLNPIQEAFKEEGATQCGFCTPGFIVSLAGFCLSEKEPSYENAIAAIDGNICRCTGYKSIERAAARLVDVIKQRNGSSAIDFVTDNSVLPQYLKSIKTRLQALAVNGSMPITGTSKKKLGGGTDLYVQQPEAMVRSEINFLFNQNELKGIWKEDKKCYIGAAATVTDLVESDLINEHFPQIKKFIKLVSSTQIRNMATVAGNFVNASPIGDLSIFFLALNAQLLLSSGEEKREVALRDFYKGYKQLNKSEEEFIEKIWFDLPPENARFNFEKGSKRTHLDIASVNSAMLIRVDEDKIVSAAISAGGVAPIPMFLKAASSALVGKNLSEELILKIIELAQSEITPISDVRGSEAYKRLLLTQLIKAHFITLFPQQFSIEKIVTAP
ncbi:MAG TPA: FAD binding domain-containing protein, partial [Flavisolibacter sp.]|nr:FAD binding domain-containing protein [Flavisolibacter sp.]